LLFLPRAQSICSHVVKSYLRKELEFRAKICIQLRAGNIKKIFRDTFAILLNLLNRTIWQQQPWFNLFIICFLPKIKQFFELPKRHLRERNFSTYLIEANYLIVILLDRENCIEGKNFNITSRPKLYTWINSNPNVKSWSVWIIVLS
jgi:hypothetical protein